MRDRAWRLDFFFLASAFGLNNASKRRYFNKSSRLSRLMIRRAQNGQARPNNNNNNHPSRKVKREESTTVKRARSFVLSGLPNVSVRTYVEWGLWAEWEIRVLKFFFDLLLERCEEGFSSINYGARGELELGELRRLATVRNSTLLH